MEYVKLLKRWKYFSNAIWKDGMYTRDCMHGFGPRNCKTLQFPYCSIMYASHLVRVYDYRSSSSWDISRSLEMFDSRDVHLISLVLKQFFFVSLFESERL